MIQNNRKGFTLIELLIVVVIIGILAAIAIPKFANTKEKAYVASMKADLHNYSLAQESYFADKRTYGTAANLEASPYDFKLSQGNAFSSSAGDSTGFSVAVKNGNVKTTTQDECGLFGGSGTSPNTTHVTTEGAPGCY
jgi:prepilin-type N-terminal cleavage/methylation domain-containing protein